MADAYAGTREWIWTADVEAVTSGPNPALGSTRPGTYGFAIEGRSATPEATSPTS